MFKTADGKKKNSKFRAARYDRENAEKPEPKEESEPKMGEKGPRAEAHELEAKKQGNPETEGMEMGEEQAEEAVHPGIHDEVKQITADHGPAHTVHMVHDHEAMKSHVHSVHADGHEHHADHEGEGHHVNAHHHAMHAAGVPQEHIHGGDQEASGEYPQEHESPGEEEGYGEPL